MITERMKNFGYFGNIRHFKFPFKRILTRIKNSADRRGKFFDLTYEQLLEFTKISECYYCGNKVEWIPFGKKVSRSNLDRKDNDIGYTKNNLVVCCWRCNDAKGNRYTFEEFCNISNLLYKPSNYMIEFNNEFLIMNSLDMD